jgi:Ca2+/Na+ antiporter
MIALWMFAAGVFSLSAACYILFVISDPLEEIGGRLGKLLRMPEDVIASTFQAVATSGPEIVMAILAATPFVAIGWLDLELGEKACSGTLNMAFSAMDNLLGIGAVAICYMLVKRSMSPDEKLEVAPSVKIGLVFYLVSSLCLSIFIRDNSLSVFEAWVLAAIGIAYVLFQFVAPSATRLIFRVVDDTQEEDNEEVAPLPTTVFGWGLDFTKNIFAYVFLVFALVVFVRICLSATFNMGSVGLVSVGGILIMFTSYVSSFPEFMLAFRYAKSVKKDALLSMLFGSNVIDLAFAGFRPLWVGESMQVYTTGRFPQLLSLYIWALPVLAVFLLVFLTLNKVKAKYAWPMVFLYVAYIVSGFILL